MFSLCFSLCNKLICTLFTLGNTQEKIEKKDGSYAPMRHAFGYAKNILGAIKVNFTLGDLITFFFYLTLPQTENIANGETLILAR